LGEAQTYDLIHSGSLIAVQVGGSTRIRRTDAEAWAASLQPYMPNGSSGRQKRPEVSSVDVDADPALKKLLLSDVSMLNLGARATHYVCHDHGVTTTIKDLVQFTEAEILRMPGVSRITVGEIRAKLAAHGLRLGMRISESLCEEVEVV
jgi:excisionase family DNA binding protein